MSTKHYLRMNLDPRANSAFMDDPELADTPLDVELDPTDDGFNVRLQDLIVGTVTEDADRIYDLNGQGYIISKQMEVKKGESAYTATLVIEMGESFKESSTEKAPIKKSSKGMATLMLILGIILIVLGALVCIVTWPFGVICIIIGILCILFSRKYKKQ